MTVIRTYEVRDMCLTNGACSSHLYIYIKRAAVIDCTLSKEKNRSKSRSQNGLLNTVEIHQSYINFHFHAMKLMRTDAHSAHSYHAIMNLVYASFSFSFSSAFFPIFIHIL